MTNRPLVVESTLDHGLGFCPEGCYWPCEHRGLDSLMRQFRHGEVTPDGRPVRRPRPQLSPGQVQILEDAFRERAQAVAAELVTLHDELGAAFGNLAPSFEQLVWTVAPPPAPVPLPSIRWGAPPQPAGARPRPPSWRRARLHRTGRRG